MFATYSQILKKKIYIHTFIERDKGRDRNRKRKREKMIK